MEDVKINGEKSTVETQRKDLADRAVCALVAKTDPEKESLWLPLIFHLKDTAAVMEHLVTDWLPEKYHENLGLNRKDFFQLAMAAAMFHDVGKSIKLFQWRITENRPELREQLRRSGLPMQAFTTAENPPHAAAGAELLRLEGYNEGLAAVVGAHHGKPESCENTYFYEQSPLSFGWSDTGDQNTEWGRVQKALIQWAAEQLEVEDPGEWPSCPMIAQMALTGLVIMADWIASNTTYFPMLSVDEQPRRYEAGRAARALQKLHLPKSWKVSEDWKDEGYFRRRFGFEANCIQKRTMQLAERMGTPGVMILEAPMGKGKTEAALAAAEVLMNRFDLSGAAFFLPSQATSNAMFSRMTRWAEQQPDAIKVAVELAHGQAEFNEEFAMLEKGSVSVEQGEADAEPLMQCLISWAVIVSLFPAHAGVIPAPREPTPSTAPIPCVCGGVPPVAAAPVPVAVYFPAYAGVIPYPLCAQAFSHLIPRDAGERTTHSFVYFRRFECFLSSPTLC